MAGTLARPMMANNGAPNFKPARLTKQERLDSRRKGGWRTAPKTNKFGERTQAGDKLTAKQHEIEIKRETRTFVWIRSEDRCEVCGMTERETAQICHKANHEQHEVVSRAQTRGMAPEIRFSTANTARACTPCHSLLTAHQRELITKDDPISDGAIGMNGDYDVVDADGKVLREVRRNIR